MSLLQPNFAATGEHSTWQKEHQQSKQSKEQDI
jgi:hypothetical protein